MFHNKYGCLMPSPPGCAQYFRSGTRSSPFAKPRRVGGMRSLDYIGECSCTVLLERNCEFLQMFWQHCKGGTRKAFEAFPFKITLMYLWLFISVCTRWSFSNLGKTVGRAKDLLWSLSNVKHLLGAWLLDIGNFKGQAKKSLPCSYKNDLVKRGRVRKISLWLLTSNQLFPGPPGLPFCQGANWHFLRCLEPLARLPLEYDNGGCLDVGGFPYNFWVAKVGGTI